MFGIGYQEMFIILVVAMVIFGPSRLPELAGQVGRWVRDFRRMSSDLTGEFEKTFAEVDEVKKSFQRELNSIQSEVEGVGKSTSRDLKKSSTTAKKPAALKSGTAAANTGAKRTAASSTNGAKSTLPARTRTARNGKDELGDLVVVASKTDPLADVSFLELDLIQVKSLTTGSSNGASTAPVDSAIANVRRRRAAASYGRRAHV
jgi:sec-independent protein translocase protein TatA